MSNASKKTTRAGCTMLQARGKALACIRTLVPFTSTGTQCLGYQAWVPECLCFNQASIRTHVSAADRAFTLRLPYSGHRSGHLYGYPDTRIPKGRELGSSYRLGKSHYFEQHTDHRSRERGTHVAHRSKHNQQRSYSIKKTITKPRSNISLFYFRYDSETI